MVQLLKVWENTIKACHLCRSFETCNLLSLVLWSRKIQYCMGRSTFICMYCQRVSLDECCGTVHMITDGYLRSHLCCVQLKLCPTCVCYAISKCHFKFTLYGWVYINSCYCLLGVVRCCPMHTQHESDSLHWLMWLKAFFVLGWPLSHPLPLPPWSVPPHFIIFIFILFQIL